MQMHHVAYFTNDAGVVYPWLLILYTESGRFGLLFDPKQQLQFKGCCACSILRASFGIYIYE